MLKYRCSCCYDTRGKNEQAEQANAIQKKGPLRRSKRTKKSLAKQQRDPLGIETWRIFGIEVHPDEYSTAKDDYGTNSGTVESAQLPFDKLYLTKPVIEALLKRLGIQDEEGDWQYDHLPKQFADIRVVRRSLDARRKRRPGFPNTDPSYVFVLDVDLKANYVDVLKLKPLPGRLEPWPIREGDKIRMKDESEQNIAEDESASQEKKRVVIVGAGPAGLFCALALARSGSVIPIVLERGLPVESRGKSIGALINRRSLDSDSNFAFGEGGAGTWSDGKLTTRIGRNSDAVRFVLETLVEYGAPENILVHGSPHLGTDNLVKLLRAMRLDLRSHGGEILFGAKMDELIIEHGVVKGVRITRSPALERNVGHINSVKIDSSLGPSVIMGDTVVLATGHSARDVYEKLHQEGVQLEAKGFATGFRIEHPQKLISQIQYGNEWGRSVVTGKQTTDSVNREFFESQRNNTVGQAHDGRLPVPSYRLATDAAFDGKRSRGVYSFCMCPGGQIVPASTDANEMCVNGMSFSRRDSVFANSALVVTVAPDDEILEEYREKYGVLAGLEFQRAMERRAAALGGGNLTVPVQRLPDFLAGRASTSAPPSSYRLGVKPAACHEIYPNELVSAMRDAITNHFEKQMPGFIHEDALLHAVETRTSSPLRISRDRKTYQAVGTKNLFPAGEGAGFAGGIVSAAVDGMAVANAILDTIVGRDQGSESRQNLKSVGFDY